MSTTETVRTNEFRKNWSLPVSIPGHEYNVTWDNGGRGCPHAQAPHGCGREYFSCSCGIEVSRSVCGNDALGEHRVREFVAHLRSAHWVYKRGEEK